MRHLSCELKSPIKTGTPVDIIKLIWFIIWPFGAWLYCLKYAKSRSSYLIFFLFSMVLCWHMAPYNTMQFDDFLAILERFISNDISSSELAHQIESYFSFDDDAPKEIYENILTYVVKSFTDNYHFFFLLASIPVIICQLKSLQLITSNKRFINGSWFGFWLIIMFIFPRDIITIQNPRFTTGLWLCIFGTLYYFSNKKNTIGYIIPILVAPICHSGLWLYVMIFLMFFIIPKPKEFICLIALCSIPFAFIDADLLSLINVELLPQNLEVWASIYLSDDAIAKYIMHSDRAGFWWVQASFEFLMKCTYFIMTYQLIKYFKKNNTAKSLEHIYSFYFFLFTIVNLIQFVPELGARYFWFIRIIVIYLWFKTFGTTKKKTLYLLVVSCAFPMFMRYGYLIGGALSVTTHPDIFFTPLPYLLGKGLLWDI